MRSVFVIWSLVATLAFSDSASAQFKVDQFPDGRGIVDAISRGVQDARKGSKPLPQKARSYELFYSLQLGMKAQEVVALLGLPEKQMVYEYPTPVVGTANVENRRFVCFGYSSVVSAERRIETWQVVFDDSGVRGWGNRSIDGCSM